MMDQAALDRWIPSPAVRIAHRRAATAEPQTLWQAADELRLDETRLLGRMIRWRIPGIAPRTTFGELFRHPPFCVLDEGELHLVCGLVGRIWTLRRDYPRLAGPEEFSAWSRPGTVRVVFANWVQAGRGGAAAAGGQPRSTLVAEARVEAFGVQGRVGLATVRPLISSFHQLVGSDALAAAAQSAARKRA